MLYFQHFYWNICPLR